jgi:molybdate transport system substrate-binding protein
MLLKIESWEDGMISTTMRRTAPNVAAALLSLSFLAASGSARADEIKVMASVALKSTLDDLAAKFESTGGVKVTMVYGLAAQLRQRVFDGEADDVAVLIRPLIVAKSISYSDPAKGGASGVYFAKVVDQFGLTDELKSKTILVPGAQAPELVARGEAELGVAQESEIIPVAGAAVLGPLPGNLGSVTLFTAGIAAASKAPDAAKAFIKFITGTDAAPVLKTKGFEPG